MHIHNSQHNQNFFDHFQTYTAIYYGHSELSREEKSKFECEEKKFSLLLKVAVSRQKRLQNSLLVKESQHAIFIQKHSKEQYHPLHYLHTLFLIPQNQYYRRTPCSEIWIRKRL